MLSKNMNLYDYQRGSQLSNIMEKEKAVQLRILVLRPILKKPPNELIPLEISDLCGMTECIWDLIHRGKAIPYSGDCSIEILDICSSVS